MMLVLDEWETLEEKKNKLITKFFKYSERIRFRKKLNVQEII